MNGYKGFVDMSEILEKQGADMLKAQLRRVLQIDINRFAEIKEENASEYSDVLFWTLRSIAKVLKKFGIVEYETPKTTPVIDLKALLEEVQEMIDERKAIEGPVEWE